MKKLFLMLMAFCFVMAMAPLIWAEGNDQLTVLLIQSDNSDGDVSFLDSSVGGESHSVNALGDVHHSTGQAFSGFGSSSIYFDGDQDYLSISDSQDWNLDGDFTIDLWAKFSSNEYGCFANSRSVSNYSGAFYFGHFKGEIAFIWGGSITAGISSPSSITDNSWHHLAIVRYNSNLAMYVDGIKVNELSNNTSAYYLGAGIRIGKDTYPSGSQYDYEGYIDEFRISKVARWTTDFTPPAAPYSDPNPPSLAISDVTATPVSGQAPLDVSFSTTVSGGKEPYTFTWDFGDSGTSPDQNPSHQYTSPGAYSAQVTVTDADGNTATDSMVVTVQSDASACASHAVFDSSTKILTMPYLDVPLIDPISQQEIPGSEAVFSCTMKYVNHSGGSFSIQDVTYLPNEIGDDCHAKYNYDGTIYIPNVDVTTVIVLPWGNIIEGPVETYEVTLKQLLLETSYFHLESAVVSASPVTTTATPKLSGPSVGLQNTDIDITIDNYSDAAQYTITIDGGTYVQNGNTITWTLPAVSADTEFDIEVTAQETDLSVSQTSIFAVTVTPADNSEPVLVVINNITASSSYSSSYGPEKAIDGSLGNNSTTVWFSARTSDPEPWLKIEFETAKRINQYRMARGHCGFGDNRWAISMWKLYGSDDDTNWVLLQDINTDQVDASTCSSFSDFYVISTPDYYKYYKYVFDISNYPYGVGVGELEMYEKP